MAKSVNMISFYNVQIKYDISSGMSRIIISEEHEMQEKFLRWNHKDLENFHFEQVFIIAIMLILIIAIMLILCNQTF